MTEKSSYGKFDKFLHWFMALNIFATLIFSKGMSTLPDEHKLVEYGELHIGAAIKHHLIDKDDVLVRMLPFTRARDDG